MRKLLEKIRKILKDRRTRQLLTRTVSVTAAIVVFVTTYALVLPAITMEKVAECGVEEHQHDDSCYTDKLICEIPESPGHHHTDECYSVSTVLVCQAREHIHSVENGCYDEDGNLICEIQEHTHSEDDGCYEEVRELICGLEESEGHTHDASCYQKILTCGKEVHTHSIACYHIDAASNMATEAAAVASTESAAPAASDELTTSTDEGSYEFTTESVSNSLSAGGTNEYVADGTLTGTTSTYKETDVTDGTNKGSNGFATSATASSTGTASEAAVAGYVPVLDELNFNTILNNRTGIYYSHITAVESEPVITEADDTAGDLDGSSDRQDDNRDTESSTDTVIDSASIPPEQWHRIPNNIERDTDHSDTPELGENDLLRVYLAYTIPAGSLNETNMTARYRLPENLHLTDEQMETINNTVNGIANQYVSYDTLEITDSDSYNASLGIEAVEGTRAPYESVEDYLEALELGGREAAEFISATVKVENIYDEVSGDLTGQDLVFTFTPYTVLKNRHEYDSSGQPTKAGEEVSGWVGIDFTTEQIEWISTGDKEDEENGKQTAEVVFVDPDKEQGLKEISTELTLVSRTDETNMNTVDAEDGKSVWKIDTEDTENRNSGETIAKDDNKGVIMPAMSFTDSIIVATGKPSVVENGSMSDTVAANAAESLPEEAEVSVRVEADEGTFPAGTIMVLKAVDDLGAVAEAVTETVENAASASAAPTDTDDNYEHGEDIDHLDDNTDAHTGDEAENQQNTEESKNTSTASARKPYGFQAVDITFIDKDGNEIEPSKPVRVALTSEIVEQVKQETEIADNSIIADPVVVHVDDDGNAEQMDLVVPEDVEPAKGRTEGELLEEAAAAASASDSENTSTSSDEEEAEESAEQDNAAETHTEANSEEASTVENETAVEENTETTAGNDATADGSKSVDDIAGTGSTVEFETGAFSVYAIVYTVDFHYEADGKQYEFSFPGGGFVSLAHLVETLGISTGKGTLVEQAEEAGHTDSEAINADTGEQQDSEKVQSGSEAHSGESGGPRRSEKKLSDGEVAAEKHKEKTDFNTASVSVQTKQFIADVESVTFSDPELLWVGKTDGATVRELKETNDLEIKYSGDQTVKDISRINAQTVEAGDWALISLQPFEEEQTLTVVMKDGKVFTIQVTGQTHSDNVRVQYTSADGGVVVTACAPEAALPEGTHIRVREIDPYANISKDFEEEMRLYSEACGNVANKLWQERRTLGEAKVVDISFIDADGREIEPEGDVDVSLLLAEAIKTAGGETLGLAHIPGEKDAEVELLEADIDDSETVFTSNAFSIYVVYNSNSTATSENTPVNFDYGWIRFGGDMQPRSDFPNGYYNYFSQTWPSQEGSWKWLKVELYEMKQGVGENGYNNPDNYNKISEFKYLAGTTNIVVEDYNFNGRDVLCTAFTEREYDDGTANWQFFDAKNGVETKRNYGGVPLGHDYYTGEWWWGYWDVNDPSVLRVYLSREKEVERVPHTDYIVRYYHPDGTFDSFSGSLVEGSSAKSFAYGDKINANKEVYSGLTVAAGHGALTSINTTNGTATIHYDAKVPLVKLNFYYKEKIEVREGGTVTGQPLYDTKIEGGKKIYDTSTEGLHTDKTATPVTNSANAAYNDGRTFNLTLESWNVGPSGADVGLVLDASGSMTWSSSVPEPVKVTKMPSGTSEGNLSNWLTLEQVNSILDKTRTDNSPMGYNGYTYYVQDSMNGNEFTPLGYYVTSEGRTKDDGRGLYKTNNGITFAKGKGGDGNWCEQPDEGWYYVNTSNARNYKNGSPKQYANWGNLNETGKLRDSSGNVTNTNVSNDGKNRATSFYIKDGELWAVWTRGNDNGVNRVFQSRVFIKPNDGVVKDEALQNAIARFTAILNAQSPQSQIAMTRFSRPGTGSGTNEDGFSDGQLALLNWSDNTIAITEAMNQLYGGTPSTTSNISQRDPNGGNSLQVYNYCFTGDTSTKRGLGAFMTDLTKGSDNSYNPRATNTNNSKYLIIFTDGKDTDERTSSKPNGDWTYNNNGTVTSNNDDSAIKKASTLKSNGYTIFTVLMRSGSMSQTDVDKATAFLKELSGKNGSTSAQKDDYFFDIAFDSPSALVEAFERIAREISKPLDGYMVRDYIDPRFDLIDADGNVRTRLNRYGVFTPAVITLTDGKSAMLKYDSEKKMFYIEVQNQSVPTTPRYERDVTVNTVELTVRAKDDFIGGNDILSNGNEVGQNQVFRPIDDYNIAADMPTEANSDTNTYPKKDYPKTTTNPATYGTTLLNYEDTIFLGEDISPIELYTQVTTMDDETAEDDHLSVYAGYLKRAGSKLHNDEDYYLNILETGALPVGHSSVDGEVITITDKKITLKLPYYYLEDEDNARSYAGGETTHQADKVGWITYEWKAVTTGGHTLTGNSALKDYTSTTLDTVKYQLSVSYTPDEFVGNKYIASNGSVHTESPVISDNGSVRTLTLTGQSGSNNLIRDPVGTAAAAKSTDTNSEGLAVVHVVAGKIKVKKRIEISQDSWNKLVTKAGTAGLTFTFTLKKDGEDYGTVSINTNSSTATVSGNYIELSTNWITGLPKGDYTLTETGMPTGFTFTSLTADSVVNVDGDNNNGTQFAAPTTGSVTWHIGKVQDDKPSATTYGSTDFSYAKVNDTTKEVDPNKEKAYLNAQIGKAIVLNEPPRTTEITITKVDSVTGDALTGAKFSLKEGAVYSNLEGFTITNKTTGAAITTETITVNGVSVKVFEVPTGGIKIDGLVNGTYTLTEEVIPDGYGAIEGNRTFKAVNGVVRKADDSGDYTNEDSNFTFKIQNEPGAELPSTGGSGTNAIYLIGAICVLLAGAGLAIARLQRR